MSVKQTRLELHDFHRTAGSVEQHLMPLLEESSLPDKRLSLTGRRRRKRLESWCWSSAVNLHSQSEQHCLKRTSMNVSAGIERQISGIRAAQQLILFIWMLTFLPMKMLSRQHPHKGNQISGISLRRGFSMQGDDMRRLTCCTRCLLDAAGVRLLHLYR